MQTGFIIAEYNPFHKGHEYHIAKTRELGADAVCVIMSGNFVQRGECAIAEKHKRAECAIAGGADLVLELPLKYALSSADKFAFGGVSTAAATGLPGFLSFGKRGETEVLERAALRKQSLSADSLTDYMKTNGCTYPVAVAALLREGGVSESEISTLTDPNNILAVEYITALNNIGSNLSVRGVERVGAAHDSTDFTMGYSSASFIRSRVNSGLDFEEFLPDFVCDILCESGYFPVDYSKMDAILTSMLSTKSIEELLITENISSGLENRVFDSIRSNNTLEEIAFSVKSKRYTLSRIRRLLVSAAMGITRADIASGVNYIRVLANNEKGRELLRTMKETATLPVVSNLSEVDKSDASAARDAELDYFAGKLFNLCIPSPVSGNPEYNIRPVCK